MKWLLLTMLLLPFIGYGQEKDTVKTKVAKWEDIVITRDAAEVKDRDKVGEVSGKSPFFGLTAKKGAKNAEKKLKQAAYNLGANIVLITRENTFGVTELIGIAYK